MRDHFNRLTSIFSGTACPACAERAERGERGRCAECEESVTLDLRDAGPGAAGKDQKNYRRLSAAFEAYWNGEGSFEQILEVVSYMIGKANEAVKLTTRTASKEEPGDVLDALNGLLGFYDAVKEGLGRFVSQLRQDNMPAAELELLNVRTSIRNMLALQAQYEELWRERAMRLRAEKGLK